MMRTLKRVIAILLITFIIGLTFINVVVGKYGKSQIELFASKAVQGEVSIGSMILQYYPTSVRLEDIKIKKYNEKDPLKSLNIKSISAYIEVKSLLPELILIDSVRITEPEITFDAGELGIKDFGKKAVKEVAIGMAGQALLGPIGLGLGIAKKGVDVVKGAKEKSDEKKEAEEQKQEFVKRALEQKQFIISSLHINGGKFVPVGDVLWVNKGEKIELPDIKMEKIDNVSLLKVVEELQKVVETAVKERVNPTKSNNKKVED